MFTKLIDILKKDRRTIVFTEGPDKRIQEAARRVETARRPGPEPNPQAEKEVP